MQSQWYAFPYLSTNLRYIYFGCIVHFRWDVISPYKAERNLEELSQCKALVYIKLELPGLID